MCFLILLDISFCRFNPCINGETCRSYDNGTNYCECVDGLCGCYSNPCFGALVCFPEENSGYSCLCRHGISGQNCDEAELDGFKYKAFHERKTWTDARNDCSSKGLVLSSVLSETAHDVLINLKR